MISKEEYEEDLSVDKNNLDELWETHSVLYMKYIDAYAQAGLDRDRQKERVALTKAKVEAEIRKDPSAFGLIKVTEAAVSAAIVKDIDVQNAINEYHEICRDEKIIGGAVTAMSHRKKALEKLSELHLSGYFSQPNIKPEAKVQSGSNRAGEQSSALNNSPRLKRS